MESLCKDSQGDDGKCISLFALSAHLRNSDPFFRLSSMYHRALEKGAETAAQKLWEELKSVGLPPHIQNVLEWKMRSSREDDDAVSVESEEVDPSTAFSETVTERIRVKVHSFFDSAHSDVSKGQFLFWYKVAIINEGSEPVQVLGRSWEIEKYTGERESVRGVGVMNSQPIIPPGDLFAYQSVCPLKIFPRKGKRLLGHMSGNYTLCKGSVGQTTILAEVSKFNLLLPEASYIPTLTDKTIEDLWRNNAN